MRDLRDRLQHLALLFAGQVDRELRSVWELERDDHGDERAEEPGLTRAAVALGHEHDRATSVDTATHLVEPRRETIGERKASARVGLDLRTLQSDDERGGGALGGVAARGAIPEAAGSKELAA